MPINLIPLDSTVTKENITVLIGKNILLEIIEDPAMQTLLDDKLVKGFIKAPNLCHDDVRFLIDELFREEVLMGAPNAVMSFLELAQSPEFEALLSITKKAESFMQDFVNSEFQKTIWKEFEKFIQAKFDKMPKEEMERFKADILRRTIGKADMKAVQDGNQRIISIGEKIQEKTGIDILVPSSLLLCPKCKVILSIGEFRGSKKCYICSESVKRESMERIPINQVHDRIREIWRRNIWFEAYMARLLRKLGFKTWTSVHVMGASGILHEVDVLAIRKGTVLMCECKTGKVSRNHVFNFNTKIGDLKAHVSVLALVGELPEPETREFVKKNPAIISLENMGKMMESEVLKHLGQKLSIEVP